MRREDAHAEGAKGPKLNSIAAVAVGIYAQICHTNSTSLRKHLTHEAQARAFCQARLNS